MANLEPKNLPQTRRRGYYCGNLRGAVASCISRACRQSPGGGHDVPLDISLRRRAIA